MRYVSLCSGVEASTVAWLNLGWTPLAFAEIDPFASAVLAHRFPNVPNLGDISEIDWRKFHERFGSIDVLFASTPCQSFSIAGNRLGLKGESGLMFEFVRAVRELVEASCGTGPRYVVWENVPGCLSSGPKGAKGEDFRCLLDSLDGCGYGVSWRIFDSQFARIPDGQAAGFRGPVPQRRRRVYLVGSLGTDGSGEILFERSCLRRDNPTSKKAREALAEDIGAGVGMCNSQREVLSVSTANTGANGSNVNTDGAAYTLDGTNCNAICIESAQSRATQCHGFFPTLNASHEQPYVVIDRAAFNQGENAAYPPHIEESNLMDTLVARGPHAVCYQMVTK